MLLTRDMMKLLLSKFKAFLLKPSLAVPFAAVILFNLIDAVMTALLVDTYGSNIEGNPVMREFIEIYGVIALYGFKYFAISLAGLACLIAKETGNVVNAKYAMWFVAFWYGLVVIYHTFLVVFTINT